RRSAPRAGTGGRGQRSVHAAGEVEADGALRAGQGDGHRLATRYRGDAPARAVIARSGGRGSRSTSSRWSQTSELRMTNRSPRRWVVLAATCLFLLPAREVHGQAPPAEPSTASGAQVDTPGSAPSGEAGIWGDAWVGLAGALVGAALGFGAAIAAVKLNNREAKRRHAEAVRIARLTILSEVEVNRENFAADWRRVSEEYEPSDVPPVNRAGMYPAPPVIDTAWE